MAESETDRNEEEMPIRHPSVPWDAMSYGVTPEIVEWLANNDPNFFPQLEQAMGLSNLDSPPIQSEGLCEVSKDIFATVHESPLFTIPGHATHSGYDLHVYHLPKMVFRIGLPDAKDEEMIDVFDHGCPGITWWDHDSRSAYIRVKDMGQLQNMINSVLIQAGIAPIVAEDGEGIGQAIWRTIQWLLERGIPALRRVIEIMETFGITLPF